MAREGKGWPGPGLDHAGTRTLGLLQQLEWIRTATEAAFPQMWSVLAPWQAVARRLLGGDAAAGPELLRLARRIGY